MGEIDFATYQTVKPVLVDRISAAEQVDDTAVVAATDKDHPATQSGGGVPREAFRKGLPYRAVVAARRRLGAMGCDVSCRNATQGSDIRAVMTLPNLALPQAIESFNGVLQAGLARWRENGNDAQRQAQAADATHRVGQVMRTLEHIVVVKLSIVGQPLRPPSRQQRFYGAGRSALRHDPGISQCAMQADARQQADQRTVGNLQVLNEVEAVELCFTTGQPGQVPTFRWRGSALATHSIEGAAPLQHAVDGGTRNNDGMSIDRRQRLRDRIRAVLSQHAVFAQVSTRLQNLRFPARRRPIPGPAWLAISKVDPRQGLASRMFHPMAHGTDAHRKTPGHCAHRLTVADRSHHRHPTHNLGAFLP